MLFYPLRPDPTDLAKNSDSGLFPVDIYDGALRRKVSCGLSDYWSDPVFKS